MGKLFIFMDEGQYGQGYLYYNKNGIIVPKNLRSRALGRLLVEVETRVLF